MTFKVFADFEINLLRRCMKYGWRELDWTLYFMWMVMVTNQNWASFIFISVSANTNIFYIYLYLNRYKNIFYFLQNIFKAECLKNRFSRGKLLIELWVTSYHLSFQLTATLNLCLIYHLKLLVHML